MAINSSRQHKNSSKYPASSDAKCCDAQHDARLPTGRWHVGLQPTLGHCSSNGIGYSFGHIYPHRRDRLRGCHHECAGISQSWEYSADRLANACAYYLRETALSSTQLNRRKHKRHREQRTSRSRPTIELMLFRATVPSSQQEGSIIRECPFVQPCQFFHHLEWPRDFARAGEPSRCRHKYDDYIASGELCRDDADWRGDYDRSDVTDLHAQLYRWNQRNRPVEHEQLDRPGRIQRRKIVSTTAYRNTGSGGRTSGNTYLYGYVFPTDVLRVVKSLTLPNNRNIVIVGLSLTTSPNPTIIPGTYTYTPPAGSIPNAGTVPLNVAFTPTDPSYGSATGLSPCRQ